MTLGAVSQIALRMFIRNTRIRVSLGALWCFSKRKSLCEENVCESYNFIKAFEGSKMRLQNIISD